MSQIKELFADGLWKTTPPSFRFWGCVRCWRFPPVHQRAGSGTGHHAGADLY